MSIKQKVLGLVEPVCANTWAIELPNSPTWPAIVFEIDSKPEGQWVYGGGYDQHTVSVVVLAETLGEIEGMKPSIRTALETDPQSLGIEDEGDADYEADAEVYAYYFTAVFRTPRY